MNTASSLMRIESLGMRFGGIHAVQDVSFDIPQGAIIALIGPNGAGKTTLFNCLTGINQPTSGKIYWLGNNGNSQQQKLLNRYKPNQVTVLGIARTFQNIRLFADMTVLDNVMVGRHCRTSSFVWDALFRLPRHNREEQESLEKSLGLLNMVGLGDKSDDLARNLPYGAQRRLEIARALATDPQLLLLDEPAAGLNAQETEELDALILKIRNELGITVLLIEHDMKLVMRISEDVVVMEEGRLIARGSPEQVSNDPVVIRAYLGTSE